MRRSLLDGGARRPSYDEAMGSTERRRFLIRFDGWYGGLSTLLLLPPSRAFVEVARDEVAVQMGWAFRARFPRAAVRAARQMSERPLSRGVHGFAGRWLVNGSGEGIVTIDLADDQRARVLGCPVRLRQLLVSAVEPAALVAALGTAGR
jgi:hypothetical protein